MSPRNLFLNCILMLYMCSTVTASTVFTKTHISALEIPDDQTPVESVLHIDDAITIEFLTLRINRIEHTAVGDLQLRLIGPNSAIALVFFQHDGLNDNIFGMWLDDRSASPLVANSAPFTGIFEPYEPMSAFTGLSTLNSDWILQLLDNGGGDSGRLYSWSLAVNEPLPEPSTMAMLLIAAGGFVVVRLRGVRQ